MDIISLSVYMVLTYLPYSSHCLHISNNGQHLQMQACIHSFNLARNLRMQVSTDKETKLRKNYRHVQGYQDSKGQAAVASEPVLLLLTDLAPTVVMWRYSLPVGVIYSSFCFYKQSSSEHPCIYFLCTGQHLKSMDITAYLPHSRQSPYHFRTQRRQKSALSWLREIKQTKSLFFKVFLKLRDLKLRNNIFL